MTSERCNVVTQLSLHGTFLTLWQPEPFKSRQRCKNETEPLIHGAL